jgi:hypothetical protein
MIYEDKILSPLLNQEEEETPEEGLGEEPEGGETEEEGLE